MIFNINSLLMVFIYFPSNFLIANFLFEHLGVHLALTIGCVLDCLCLWVRVLINQNFYLAMVGGLFCGIAQPLIMNANAEFATNWFDTSEVRICFRIEENRGRWPSCFPHSWAPSAAVLATPMHCSSSPALTPTILTRMWDENTCSTCACLRR